MGAPKLGGVGQAAGGMACQGRRDVAYVRDDNGTFIARSARPETIVRIAPVRAPAAGPPVHRLPVSRGRPISDRHPKVRADPLGNFLT